MMIFAVRYPLFSISHFVLNLSSLCPNLFPFALILPSEIDYFYRDIYLLVHDDNDIDNDDGDDFEW